MSQRLIRDHLFDDVVSFFVISSAEAGAPARMESWRIMARQ